MKQLIINALEAKYTADLVKAEAELEILLSNSVGIGEHSNIITECDLKIKQISEAIENLQTLQKIKNQ